MAGFGPRRMMGRAPRFPFLFVAVQKASRALLRREELGELNTSVTNHRTADSASMLPAVFRIKDCYGFLVLFSVFWLNEVVDAETKAREANHDRRRFCN